MSQNFQAEEMGNVALNTEFQVSFTNDKGSVVFKLNQMDLVDPFRRFLEENRIAFSVEDTRRS